VAGSSLIVHTGPDARQRALQHHNHPISCAVVTADGTRIVSADKGPASQICVWDATTCDLIRSIPSPHGPCGMTALDISPDGNFLLTLAAEDGPGNEQDVALWDVSCPYTTPRARTVVPAGDVQRGLCVNPDDPAEVRMLYWEESLHKR
jgi:WD40 repeat protein